VRVPLPLSGFAFFSTDLGLVSPPFADLKFSSPPSSSRSHFEGMFWGPKSSSFPLFSCLSIFAKVFQSTPAFWNWGFFPLRTFPQVILVGFLSLLPISDYSFRRYVRAFLMRP